MLRSSGHGDHGCRERKSRGREKALIEEREESEQIKWLKNCLLNATVLGINTVTSFTFFSKNKKSDGDTFLSFFVTVVTIFAKRTFYLLGWECSNGTQHCTCIECIWLFSLKT